MSKHNKIGVKGEQTAADFLLNKGYIILHRNWRSGNKEIDIIAAKEDMIVMVEIKTRSSATFAFPEDSVTRKKQALLKAAAHAFMDAHPQYLNFRYDIISILVSNDDIREIVHFEEAFY
ncbi:MAG: YraN family protein [Bacteroidota bacterium]